MTDISEILKDEQLEELEKAGLYDKAKIRAASDEELVGVRGIGLATAEKLREWAIPEEMADGDAISKRFLVLKHGAERLDVRPGDLIPAKFGAENCVKSGKATWK